jgi:hypothetical protein
MAPYFWDFVLDLSIFGSLSYFRPIFFRLASDLAYQS